MYWHLALFSVSFYYKVWERVFAVVIKSQEGELLCAGLLGYLLLIVYLMDKVKYLSNISISLGEKLARLKVEIISILLE